MTENELKEKCDRMERALTKIYTWTSFDGGRNTCMCEIEKAAYDGLHADAADM